MCLCGGLCMCVCYVLFRSDDKIHCYLLVCVCVCLLERERGGGFHCLSPGKV